MPEFGIFNLLHYFSMSTLKYWKYDMAYKIKFQGNGIWIAKVQVMDLQYLSKRHNGAEMAPSTFGNLACFLRIFGKFLTKNVNEILCNNYFVF